MANSAAPQLHGCVRAFEDHFDYVRRTLRRQGVPDADVEDLAQEVFIIMWRRWSEFDQRRGLRPWLAGIAFNVIGSHHLRRPRREIPVAEPEAMDPAPHGEESLAAMRARRVVLRALERLSERYRTILILRDIEGMPMRQIAALQGVPLFTAYTRLRKARRDFADAVKVQEKPVTRRPALFPTLSALLRTLLPVAVTAALVGMIGLDSGEQARARPLLAAGQASLARGLVGYWRLDDAGAPTVRDLSGHGGDCLVRDRDLGPAWTSGRLGAAVQLGARAWLECPQPAVTKGGPDELTVSTWVKIASLPSRRNRAVVSRQLGPGAEDHFFLGFVDTRLTLSSHSWDVVIRRVAPVGDGWHHLAFTKSRSAVALFLDGRLVGREMVRGLRAEGVSAPILVGGGSNQRDVVHELLDGSVDELLLYERALDEKEIAALAAGVQPIPLTTVAAASPAGN